MQLDKPTNDSLHKFVTRLVIGDYADDIDGAVPTTDIEAIDTKLRNDIPLTGDEVNLLIEILDDVTDSDTLHPDTVKRLATALGDLAVSLAA